MITKAAVEERVREWGLREDVVEKDYVLGWLLWGIGSDATLAKSWVFKGGTCLKKCYIETYRFSEDLDFTVLPGGPILPADLPAIFKPLLQRVADESGLDFSGKEPVFKSHGGGSSTEGRIYYRGPRGAPMVASVKVDLNSSEKLCRPAVPRTISHSYPEALPAPATVPCYSFEEVFAEKIRAMGERSRPRDLYDIVNLFRRPDLQDRTSEVRTILAEKCAHKKLPIPTFASLDGSSLKPELISEWANMLAHQLPKLPPFESYWADLPTLFAWLEGAERAAELMPLLPPGLEAMDDAWSPPPTVQAWGKRVSLETIRFAAANHLCVELGYQGTRRLIEPYALRRTKAGNFLLYAIRVDDREPRSYRVDAMESVAATDRPFTPAYRIEFSESGPLSAPPILRPPANFPFPLRASKSRHHGAVTIVRCPVCSREFRRTTKDRTMKAHKSESGGKCYGEGRPGVFVETRNE